MKENDIRSGLFGHGLVDPQRQRSSAHVLRVSCEQQLDSRRVREVMFGVPEASAL